MSPPARAAAIVLDQSRDMVRFMVMLASGSFAAGFLVGFACAIALRDER